ncbi:MAG: TonB-dependent receptor [Deltaproteobacteria bacterium]|nr:TonB-dependent receptor [Deltaproteobacteria bacterium]MBI3387958.1 TonB-dependent receptor [Deltaproteobacteria bacterium]
MAKTRTGLTAALLLCVVVSAARAADVAQSTPDPEARALLAPIVVTATRIPQPLAEVPASVSVVEQPDIQDARPTVNLDESLDRVPGVLVQNSGNFAQDARIQIRGFGTRAAFGVREIKVLLDGLPETLPDGQTELDDVDLGAVHRIEVLRGPASSLYGNASGGVIQLFTEDGPNTPTASARLTGGSFGLQKYQIKGGGRAGNARLFVSASYLGLDGFRNHSDTESTIVNAKLRYDLNESTEITTLISAVDSPIADDPGGLTRAQANANPKQARDLNVRLDAGEAVQQGRIGWVATHHHGVHEVSAYTYLLYRDFDNNLPIAPATGDGHVSFHRFSPGGGVRYVNRAQVFDVAQTFSLGVDVQYQDDERRRAKNVNGTGGALSLQQREQVTGVGPYLREAVTLFDDWEVSAGVRYDTINFSVDVNYPSNSDASGSQTFDHWSPAGGVRYSATQWLSLYGNISTAFQVPTTTELANPSGPGFNPNVEPQTATTYELGAHLDWAPGVRAGLAGFWSDIDNELIPFETPSGRTGFQSVGSSRRKGIEGDWQVALLPSVRLSGAVTLIDAEFRDYTVRKVSFNGNDEPGIPRWQVYQELAYRDHGLFAAIEAFEVDGYFVNDANTARSPSYALVNARAEYDYPLGAITIAPFVGLNNLLDATYDGTVRLNALGGRYFEPAPGFNVFGGVLLSAQL